MVFWNILDKVEKTDIACCGTSLMVKLEMRVLHAACIKVKVRSLCCARNGPKY